MKKTDDSLTDSATTKQLYALAYRYYESRHYREAVHFFRVLCAMDCDDPKHWLGLGAAYQMLKDYDEALPAYGLAAVLDQTNPQVHLHAADCFIALKRIPDARNALALADQHLKQANDQELRSLLALLKADCDNRA
jgi:type III secretion system low calcium response chaperone LcrH/SycD